MIDCPDCQNQRTRETADGRLEPCHCVWKVPLHMLASLPAAMDAARAAADRAARRCQHVDVHQGRCEACDEPVRGPTPSWDYDTRKEARS